MKDPCHWPKDAIKSPGSSQPGWAMCRFCSVGQTAFSLNKAFCKAGLNIQARPWVALSRFHSQKATGCESDFFLSYFYHFFPFQVSLLWFHCLIICPFQCLSFVLHVLLHRKRWRPFFFPLWLKPLWEKSNPQRIYVGSFLISLKNLKPWKYLD